MAPVSENGRSMSENGKSDRQWPQILWFVVRNHEIGGRNILASTKYFRPNKNMKMHVPALLVAMVAVGLPVGGATYNGDLFLGFTAQNGTDLIYDIGPAGSLVAGQSWNVSSYLTGADITSLSDVKWGVIGDKNVLGIRYAWSTSAETVPSSIPNSAVWGTLDTPARSIASQFTTIGVGQSVSPDSSFDNSWKQQTIAGTLTTQYHNAYGDPNIQGVNSGDFYQVRADGSAPEAIGSFSLTTDGTVRFVPEPGTWKLLGMSLVGFAVVLRRKLFRSA